MLAEIEPSGIFMNLGRTFVWLVVSTLLFVPLERLLALHPQKIFRQGLGIDLVYYLQNSIVPTLLWSGPASVIAWSIYKLLPDQIVTMAGELPVPARVALGLLVGEIGYYWYHRCSHSNRFLWRFHAIHHSAEQMSYLVSSRGHFFDIAFGRICALVPVAAFGLGGPMAPKGSLVSVAITMIGLSWGFFVHSNIRLRFGPLEWLLSTPAFHHWHHTQFGPIDRNFASMLPWLDRIFGTHYLPPNQWPASYGIQERIPETYLGQLFFPLSDEPPDWIVKPDENQFEPSTPMINATNDAESNSILIE